MAGKRNSVCQSASVTGGRQTGINILWRQVCILAVRCEFHLLVVHVSMFVLYFICFLHVSHLYSLTAQLGKILFEKWVKVS